MNILLDNLHETLYTKNNIPYEKHTYELYGIEIKQRAILLSSICNKQDTQKLILTKNEDDAILLKNELSAYTKNVFYYPARDLLFFYADINKQEVTADRVCVRNEIDNNKNAIVVVSIDAIVEKVENKKSFNDKKICINLDSIIDLTHLINDLTLLSYERVDKVEYSGSFCVRGGIIDIFPISSSNPVRIELWGDEINDIKLFDVNTQRSIDNLNSIEIYPNYEATNKDMVPLYDLFDTNTLVFINDSMELLNIYKNIDLSKAEFDTVTFNEFFSFIKDTSLFCINTHKDPSSILEYKKSIRINVDDTPKYRGNISNFISDLKNNFKNKKIFITSSSNRQLNELLQLLNDNDINASIPCNDRSIINNGEILLLYCKNRYGFIYDDYIVFTEIDLWGRKSIKTTTNNKYNKLSSNELLNIKINDYVIHEDNGIGIYRGIVSLENNGIKKDYIKIDYANNASYYTPADRMHTLQIYNRFDNKAPTLDKLGGSKWTATKSRAKTAIETMAKELIDLYAQRLNKQGYIYSPDSIWQKEFEDSFEYVETNDQLKALAEIKSDMESSKIMDRIICGDVGFGKTEIAIRTAFKVVLESRQVIYLAPTTILASQHFDTFTKRMHNFPVKIQMLSRFKTAKEQNQIIEDFNNGRIDILIGTQMVVSNKISGKNIGLLIVDEEQRLGVKIKEKIKEIKTNVDVLTLTATPIPRTLHMSLSGIRDLSLLLEPPVDRKPIKTYVMAYDNEVIKEAINREISRSGQVYFIHNRIEDIYNTKKELSVLLPHLTFEVVHAKMSPNDIEDIMYDFINKHIDVLISTTIVETGLDIANVNTIIIDDATRLGLSQLYQLRGRVGRSNVSSYAFLLYDMKKNMTINANKRLNAIREYTKLGSGIKIATKDMEIRGSGNILGLSQHGHMQAIGYELYCKILNLSLRKLKGEQNLELIDNISIDIPITATIPEKYIDNEKLRLEMYKKISDISTNDEITDIYDELFDRFGNIPTETENLLLCAKIKVMLNALSIKELSVRDNFFILHFDDNASINPDIIKNLAVNYKNNIHININNGLSIKYFMRDKRSKLKETLDELINFLDYSIKILTNTLTDVV